MPLSAGEQTRGAGGAELRGLDAQLSRPPSLQCLISRGFPCVFHDWLGVGSLGQPMLGLGARSEA